MAAPTLLLLAAALLQGALAIGLVILLGTIRLPLVAHGRVKLGDIALSRLPWPEREKKVSNAFDNQFQLPMLFYVATGMSLYFGAGWLDAVLALLFVGTRYVHAAIFITSNHVVRRFYAYSAGLTVLGLWWLFLAVRLVSAAAGSV